MLKRRFFLTLELIGIGQNIFLLNPVSDIGMKKNKLSLSGGKMKITAIILFLSLFLNAETRHQMTIEDMWAMKRMGGITVNPATGQVIFRVTTFNMAENSSSSEYYYWSGDSTAPRPLFHKETAIRGFSWYKDGLLVLQKTDSGMALLSFNYNDSTLKKLDLFPKAVSGLVAGGNLLAFVSGEYAEASTLAEAKKLDQRVSWRKATGVVYDELLYRHWDTWLKNRYNHLYIYDLRNSRSFLLTPGKSNVPPIGLSSGHDIDISPNGEIVAFVRNPDPMPAISTNNEVYLYNHISKEIKIISKNSPGNDNAPRFSPDGRYLAYLSMEHAGFEADQRRFVVYDLKDDELKKAEYTLDVSVSDYAWGRNSRYIYFTADYRGYHSLFRYDFKTQETKLLLEKVFITSLAADPARDRLYLVNQSFSSPAELFTYSLDTGEMKQITHLNDERLSGIAFGKVDEFSFIGADKDTVHGWIIYPPNFNPQSKYGLLQIIHGGPQGAIGNSFHYRWNMQLFATFGYVVTAINFHGSTGYGQAFTNRISKDWGGAPFEDIMKGTDYLFKTYSFLDSTRLGAAGASYGGFMINWINGHTDRFKALVCHDGVFDQRSMYGATEELWFPEWEMGGTPYEVPDMYNKFSPSSYVKNMKTPMLVIHGGKDYRVPLSQGLQAFTALQRNGVPSRLLYFPDENHFVLQPQNAKLWWTTVYKWFQKYMPAKVKK